MGVNTYTWLGAAWAVVLLAATPALAQDSGTNGETAGQAAEAAGAVEGIIAQQPLESHLASTIMDAEVINATGEQIGDVDDMIIGKDGELQALVVGVGGFLGVGEKAVAIEMESLSRSTNDEGELVFVFDTTSEDLEAAPEFESIEERDQEPTGAGQEGPAGDGMAPAEQVQ